MRNKKTIRGMDKYNTDEFENKIKQIFLKIQNAWNKNKPEELLHIESSLLYERDAEKMRMYTSKGLKEVRNNIVINYAEADEYFEAGTKKFLKIKIKASMERYVYDTITGEIVNGIREYNETKVYILTLAKEEEKDGNIKMKCDACGADVNIRAIGKCEYCGTIFHTDEYDWTVVDIEEYKDKNEGYYPW